MFEFTSKIRYSFICLCDIILYGKKNSVPLSDIIRRQKVPKNYIKRILSELVKSGILISRKGARGGFLLKKRQKDISLYTLYEIFSPGVKKKTVLKKTRNKKVKNILEKTRESVNNQFISMLKNIKFNILLNTKKRKRQ